MPPEVQDNAYTSPQVAAVTGLPLPAVQKAIEHKLIQPRRVREGRVVRRLLAKWQLVYLAMEARGLSSLPLATRRHVARAVERDPGIDVIAISEGSVVLIQCKFARRDVDKGLRRLADASRMVESDPEVLRGTVVYKGTRIPVQLVADMLSQGASVEEILDGYPSLTREKIELAPMYVKAFPHKGRPARRPWARREPGRSSRQRLTI
jgi:uncharacterized protein (DUF433 family)